MWSPHSVHILMSRNFQGKMHIAHRHMKETRLTEHYIVHDLSFFRLPEFCFEFGQDDTKYGKQFVKLHPPPQFQKKQLEAFTVDFHFRPFSASKTPVFLSYGTVVDEAETEFEQKILLYLPKGYLLPDPEITAGLKLYDEPGRNRSAPVRITIAGDKEGFSVFFDTEKKVSKQNEWETVPMAGSWVMGQEQEEFEGGFHLKDRVRGKICNFQMWDFKLNEDQLGLLFASDISLRGNLFDSPPTYQYDYKNQNENKIENENENNKAGYTAQDAPSMHTFHFRK